MYIFADCVHSYPKLGSCFPLVIKVVQICVDLQGRRCTWCRSSGQEVQLMDYI